MAGEFIFEDPTEIVTVDSTRSEPVLFFTGSTQGPGGPPRLAPDVVIETRVR